MDLELRNKIISDLRINLVDEVNRRLNDGESIYLEELHTMLDLFRNRFKLQYDNDILEKEETRCIMLYFPEAKLTLSPKPHLKKAEGYNILIEFPSGDFRQTMTVRGFV